MKYEDQEILKSVLTAGGIQDNRLQICPDRALKYRSVLGIVIYIKVKEPPDFDPDPGYDMSIPILGQKIVFSCSGIDALQIFLSIVQTMKYSLYERFTN